MRKFRIVSFHLISQVQQRGVTGTKEILLKIVDGLDITPDAMIFVTDLIPNRLVTSLEITLFPNVVAAGSTNGAVLCGICKKTSKNPVAVMTGALHAFMMRSLIGDWLLKSKLQQTP